MKSLLRFARAIDSLQERLGHSVYWLMLIMVAVGTFNAIARYMGRSLGRDLSSNAYLELQWYLFGIMFLFGGAYTLKKDAHVRVDVLYDRMSARTRAWVNILGHLLFLLPFCVVMLWMSWNPVLDSWSRLEVSRDPGGLPRYLIKSIIPIGFLFLLLQGMAEIIKGWHSLKQDQELSSPPDQGHL